jgi:hypothetical protein
MKNNLAVTLLGYVSIALVFVVTMSFLLLGCLLRTAGADEAPPLPLHGFEGYGGIAITYTAYLTNPAQDGATFGKPSVGAGAVFTDHNDYLGFGTITETLWDRLELGYGFNALYLADLQDDIQAATGIKIDDTVYLHNFNVRLALIKEGEFDQAWLPAITFGAHYKYNDTISDIDDDLFGTLTNIGIKDNDGIDYTLYASKMLTFLPRPILLNVGARSTEAAHMGFLGFTDDRDLKVEGNVVAFLTDRFALGAEYRQKPNSYQEIPGLVGEEDDCWSLVFAYVFNNHLTVSGGYFELGQMLNHPQDDAFGLKIKWEF